MHGHESLDRNLCQSLFMSHLLEVPQTPLDCRLVKGRHLALITLSSGHSKNIVWRLRRVIYVKSLQFSSLLDASDVALNM